MRKLILIAAMFKILNAETIKIDSGGSTDSNYAGGAAYEFAGPVTGSTDLTMRSGSFVYDIPCHDDWPYIVKFEFFEPVVTGPSQRVFSVRVNNQIVLDRLDVFKEAGSIKKAINRSVVVLGANGHLIISFEPLVRTAIVSSISFTPLFQIQAATDKKLHDSAWTVINTRCTRCHGADLIPGDVHLVGNLDMRTRESIIVGGSRGPALKPGDLFGSLIYLFASHCQVCSMTTTMSGQSLPPLRELQTNAQMAGFALILPDSSEDSVGMPPYAPLTELELIAIRDWIIAGAL